MTDYRLYFFDSGRHIRRALDLHCSNEEEAIAAAQAEADGGPMELWRGPVLVRSFPDSRDG